MLIALFVVAKARGYLLIIVNVASMILAKETGSFLIIAPVGCKTRANSIVTFGIFLANIFM